MSMLKKLRRYRDTFRHKPTDDSDSDPYDPPMPTKPVASSQIATSRRTLYYAQQQGRSLVPSTGKPLPRSGSGSVASRPTPDSSAVQYWAARAATAEVLLAERSKHTHELRSVIHEEDAKRREEIAALHGAHEARQRKMEWIVMCCIVVLVVVVLCLLVTHYLASSRTPTRRMGATHFTIPVLSPFTSVVEHETSAWGARIVVPALMIVATLAWGVFRHWTSQKWLR